MAKKENPQLSKKIFVLDTSVILYDHNAVNNFQEHDVAVPALVLEELDNFKSGNDTRNFEARNFIRIIDSASKSNLLNKWSVLNKQSTGRFKIQIDEQPSQQNAETLFSHGKFDNRILNAALVIKEEHPNQKVVLVSKDICLRLKAKALALHAEDYETGKVKNVGELYSGKTILKISDAIVLDDLKKNKVIDASSLDLPYTTSNHFYILKNKRKEQIAFYNVNDHSLKLVEDEPIFGVSPRNAEQSFAIEALLNPAIKLVTIQGNAGTGKTLLALGMVENHMPW